MVPIYIPGNDPSQGSDLVHSNNMCGEKNSETKILSSQKSDKRRLQTGTPVSLDSALVSLNNVPVTLNSVPVA